MKTKLIMLFCSLTLLAASCNLTGAPETAGVLKTANGGVDWQLSNKLKNSQSGIDDLSISKLAFDPLASEVIYAGSLSGGLYVSKDGGGAWEEVLGQIPVLDFAIHPNDNETIYVAGTFDNHGRVLITKDGGKSWNEIFSEAEPSGAVRSIALNPLNPQEVLIGLHTGGLIKSDDAGATWRLVVNYNDRINRIIWRPEATYVVVRGTGVFKSTDGANSFQQITAGLNNAGNNTGVSIFGSNISTYNQLAISDSSPDTLYVTTNLGLYRSINGGNSWGFVSMPLRQRELAPVAVGVAPSSSNVVYVGAGSHIYKSSDGGNSWLTTDTGTNNAINALLVSPDLPQVAYAGIFN